LETIWEHKREIKRGERGDRGDRGIFKVWNTLVEKINVFKDD
jgi:hypothetical protein